MKKIRTAGDIMIHPVFAVRETWSVRELASYFIEKSISGAPVLDEGGRPTGVVSLSDIVDQVTRDREPASRVGRGWQDRYAPEDLRGLQIEDEGRLVRDIMTPTIFTVPEDTPLPKIARTMVAGRVHRLLVTRKGHVVGILTTLDVLRELAGRGPRARTRRTAAMRPAGRATRSRARTKTR
jgi:predicted transcriptional regulator